MGLAFEGGIWGVLHGVDPAEVEGGLLIGELAKRLALLLSDLIYALKLEERSCVGIVCGVSSIVGKDLHSFE
ncbi:hypothetical protein Taro_026545 [Colocasia esculenta]|uniref:Uncharacterized protein n=1 Tax=Colocasia esculenta TaxID=4460 RepID=A0A843VBP1_COLES|nr:hypothetical protein [Colocasia esculenta]